ncbi:hypothetical protein [Desulfogranum marinum]|uniref:hypothetical protein n=1 Tax=Desulfogranum marinum TaxID=453220 RepID=UPI0029C646C5|nr:hypothetical protein [Desulfogranum marinum]
MNLQYAAESSASQLRTPWLENRRKFFIRQVVSDFFQAYEMYHGLYQDFCHSYHFAMLEAKDLLQAATIALRTRLLEQLTAMLGAETSRGLLWRLKDLCHTVWPESERQKNVLGSLVDWLIGSLFHEAMKLKENLYLLNNYGPSVFPVDQDTGSENMAYGARPFSVSQVIDTHEVFKRIAVDTEQQVERIALTFGRAIYLLRLMMSSFAENELVVRLLVEKEEVVGEIWGESLESIFDDMFYGNAPHGYCIAGNSYFRSQWYHHSQAMFRRALQIDKQCQEAVIKLIQLEAITSDMEGQFGKTA